MDYHEISKEIMAENIKQMLKTLKDIKLIKEVKNIEIKQSEKDPRIITVCTKNLRAALLYQYAMGGLPGGVMPNITDEDKEWTDPFGNVYSHDGENLNIKFKEPIKFISYNFIVGGKDET